MEHRSQNLAALLIFCFAALSGVACAQEADPAVAPKEPQMADMETAKAMQTEAESLRRAADALLEEENAACARKFLVNDCRNTAKKRHLESLRAARDLAAQGRKIEYQARLQERKAKRKERAAKAEERKLESAPAPDCPGQDTCATTHTLP